MSRCVRGLETGWRVCPPRGYSARTGRAPRRHKNGEYAAKPPARPAFQRHEAHVEGSDTTPTQKCRKCKTGVLSPPPTGLPPKPSEAVSVGRGRATESASPAAHGAGREIRRPLGRRPASHLSGLRRSRCPAKCTERAKPCTQIPGESPDPLKATIGEKHEKRYQIQHAHGVR